MVSRTHPAVPYSREFIKSLRVEVEFTLEAVIDEKASGALGKAKRRQRLVDSADAATSGDDKLQADLAALGSASPRTSHEKSAGLLGSGSGSPDVRVWAYGSYQYPCEAGDAFVLAGRLDLNLADKITTGPEGIQGNLTVACAPSADTPVAKVNVWADGPIVIGGGRNGDGTDATAVELKDIAVRLSCFQYPEELIPLNEDGTEAFSFWFDGVIKGTIAVTAGNMTLGATAAFGRVASSLASHG